MAAELDTCIKPPTAEIDNACVDQTMDQPEFAPLAADLETKRQKHFLNGLEKAKEKYPTGWGWFYKQVRKYLPPDVPPKLPMNPAMKQVALAFFIKTRAELYEEMMNDDEEAEEAVERLKEQLRSLESGVYIAEYTGKKLTDEQLREKMGQRKVEVSAAIEAARLGDDLSLRILAECDRGSEKKQLGFDYANEDLAGVPLLRLTDQRLILSSKTTGGLYRSSIPPGGKSHEITHQTGPDDSYVLVVHGANLKAEYAHHCKKLTLFHKKHDECRVKITGRWYRYLPGDAGGGGDVGAGDVMKYNVNKFANFMKWEDAKVAVDAGRTVGDGAAGDAAIADPPITDQASATAASPAAGTAYRNAAKPDGSDIYNFASFEAARQSLIHSDTGETTVELDCSYFTGHQTGTTSKNAYTDECKRKRRKFYAGSRETSGQVLGRRGSQSLQGHQSRKQGHPRYDRGRSEVGPEGRDNA